MDDKDYDPELMRKYPSYGLYFRRYTPFDTFGRFSHLNFGLAGFAGDHRTTASTSLQASARTYGCVMFNRYQLVYDFAGTSGSQIEMPRWATWPFDPKTVGFATVVSTVVRGTLVGPSLLDFTASTEGSNPLVRPSPNIDTIIKGISRTFGAGIDEFATVEG